jgi:hypothetical protein
MENIEYNLFQINLNFQNELYTDLFKFKNNKTLRETLKSSRYQSFENEVLDKYSQHLDKKLGEFLFMLKSNNDEFYKKFLNKYGDLEYSTFFIANQDQYTLKGVYFYYVDNELKYIGRCRDNMQKRINSGYGSISPKNCYLDGQSTNCKVNSYVTKHKEKIILKILPLDDIKEIEEIEKVLISKYRPILNTRN